MSAPIDGAAVFDRLAQAHGTLALLPVKSWPSGFMLSGGEIGAVVDAGRCEKPPGLRLPPPDRAAIGQMDEALEWLRLLPAPPSPIRSAVQLRVLTSPYTGRPHLTWPEIGKRLGCSHTHARTLCMEGIAVIAAGLRRQLEPAGRKHAA
ncbi:MAG: hypothetical protein ACRYHQ_35265 [Janthinobacterium lividum]